MGADLKTEWTDRDYAQAAIDMLPGTVEEIDALMGAHRIYNYSSAWRSTSCPVAQWVHKWVGDRYDAVDFDDVIDSEGEWYVELPQHVRDYIFYADRSLLKP